MGAEERVSSALREFMRVLGQGALSSPTRLSIMLTLVLRGSATFSELQRFLGLTAGNLGAHLERLEREGFVRRYKCVRGLRYVTCYRPTDVGARAVGEVLRAASELWSALGGRDTGQGGGVQGAG